jgi:hypothetical protein
MLPITFDLAKYRPSDADWEDRRDCGPEDPSEIVVCAPRRRGGAPIRSRKMERRFRRKPVLAEKDIGGGATARAYVESAEMPGGQTSKRGMVGIKWPF